MMLNSTQARKIFDKYSFLSGTEDVIDAVQTGKLFGEDAVMHVIYNHPEEESPAGGIELWDGHYRVVFTYAGFQRVIAYCNKQELINREKTLLGKVPDVKGGEWHEVKEDNKVISFEERRKQAQCQR